MNPQDLEKLTKWIRLEEMFVQHVSTLLTHNLNFEDQAAAVTTAADNSFIWGISEFCLCLNVMKLNADVPIRPDVSTILQQSLQMYFTWIREIKLTLESYIIAARQIYDGKHFSTHKILSITFNNPTAYRHSLYI